MTSRIGLAVAALLAASALYLTAGGSAVWESNSFHDFLKGRFTGMSLTREGRLVLAPKLDPLFTSDQAALWSMVAAPDGTIYAATGHRGRIFRITRDGKSSVYWNSEQPEIFAIAVDAKGLLYAGTSPDGKVYRLENGKPAEYFDPKAKYIWSLSFARDGSLYVGTGDQGRIYRVTGPGKGDLWLESGQSHITSLGADLQGRVLAGSEPNGLLYRLEGKGKAFVLYDSSLPEIRSVIPAADGSLYVAAMGGGVARQNAQAAATAAAAASASTGVTTSITVTSDMAEQAQGGVDLKAKQSASQQATAAADPTLPTPGSIEMAGVEKSAIYRIAPDNTVETLWTSKEENVYDLALEGQEVTFSTDLRGRIYRIGSDLKSMLLVETREGEATRLLPAGSTLYAGTSNLARLFRLQSGTSLAGAYESPVHDAGSVARWGRLSWRGEVSSGVTARFYTRTGNSQRPDQTWSEWVEARMSEGGASISSPNARFVQWKTEMTAPAGSAPPAIESVAVTYLPQNNRPVVRTLTITPQWSASPQKASPSSTASTTTSYSITVTDAGDDGSGTSAGTPTQNVTRSGTPQLLLSWQADDTDQDKLVYSLSFRGEEEMQWKLVKDQLTDNTYLLDSETLADGRYFFRVLASDRLSNAQSNSKESELVSSPVLVDNTPPMTRIVSAARQANALALNFESRDAASPLRRAEYSMDAGPWILAEPADGILDGFIESFQLRITPFSAGEHLVVVRVFDSSGNAGLAKTVLR